MATSAANPLVIARDLVRVSKDRSGREKSPDDQHRAHQRSAKAQGWELRGPSYRDLISASRFETRERAGFERLVTDLESEAFDAHVIMMWENSRGSRRESEWVRLIELAEARKVIFWVETLERTLDPRRPADRRDLVRAAADAAYESGLLSERSRRGIGDNAEEGLPHGRLTPGYRRIYDPKTRRPTGQEPDEGSELYGLVQEYFRRVHMGEAQRAITTDWKKRGIRNASGTPYSVAHLRDWLVNRAYIGVRVHDPERRGRKLSANAKFYPDAWAPIIDPEVFWDIQRLISRPERLKNTRPGGAVHLMTGYALCRECGSPITGAGSRQRESRGGAEPAALRMRCKVKGCVTAPEQELDALVRAVVVAYLSDRKQYSALARKDHERASELRLAEAKLAEQRAVLNDYNAAADRGELSRIEARAAAGVETRVNELASEVDRLSAPSVLAPGPIQPGPDVAERWDAATVAARRQVLSALLRTEILGVPVVRRIGPGRRREPIPLRDRVEFVRYEQREAVR
jgi:DNA invertase Pin-like site-specific DNA recombinase